MWIVYIMQFGGLEAGENVPLASLPALTITNRAKGYVHRRKTEATLRHRFGFLDRSRLLPSPPFVLVRAGRDASGTNPSSPRMHPVVIN